MIFTCYKIKFLMVNPNMPTRLSVSWDEFVNIICDNGKAVRLTHELSEMGYHIPLSRSLRISSRTTSFTLGLRLR